MISADKEAVREFVGIYRERAQRLRRAAGYTIASIAILLIAGIAIFTYAGEIARTESMAAADKNWVEEFGKQVFESEVKILASSIKSQVDQGKINQETASQLKDTAAILDGAVKGLRALQEGQTSYQGKTLYIISISTTRIGIVVLLLFLVQILVPLYRYNVKLAAFYDARADALTLVENQSTEELERLVCVLSPDVVDFSKPPESPTQQAFELVKEVIALKNKT